MISKLKIRTLFIMCLAAAVALGGMSCKKLKKLTKKGKKSRIGLRSNSRRVAGAAMISYAAIGAEKNKINPDQVIAELGSHSRDRWHGDATWWQVNIHNLRPDGTVDLTDGGIMTVKFISVARVQALTKSRRKNSIREYSLTSAGIKPRRYFPTKPWKNVRPLPTPACGIGKLVKTLAASGLKDRVRVSFDPKFAHMGPRELSWRVWSKDPKIKGYYSMATCKPTKP